MIFGKSNTLIAGAVLMGAISLGGCATKKFVRAETGLVDSHVTAVQGQVTANEGRLSQHDAKLSELDKNAQDALQRATAAGKLAEGKFVYQLVVSDDSTKFPVNKYALSPEATSRLTELANKLKSDNKNVYLEIQGHTDATGSPVYNEHLGEERAEAVRHFLSEQGVALNRMATISYGETQPAADNKSKDGRAQNRRVVVVVMT
jgi:outer membrane protein OmpA-like peptidoglycan-associated protein